MSTVEIAGQLNAAERRILASAVLDPPTKPKIVLKVGTWLGGGSTLHLLRALEENTEGHLWGIEADSSIYDQMQANIRLAAPEAIHRFTPLFGLSHEVIPRWLRQLGTKPRVDIVFLDGGNNPGEQIEEFQLLNPHIPIGGVLMAHDAKMRKGKWLVPYLSLLDNWKVQLYDLSEYGLIQAIKIGPWPSRISRIAAAIALLRMRCNPVEIAAAILPAKVCGFALGLLPKRFARRISEGCK